MQTTIRILLILSCTLVFTSVLQAQQIKYHFELNGFADNREYVNEYIDPQTIFGERAELSVGIQADEQNAAYLGLSHTYEFGGEKSMLKPDLIMYYHGNNQGFDFRIGAFPRNDLIKHPLVLLSDTLQYFRPTIQGAFFQLKKKWGYQNLWIDWLSRQTAENYETFLAGYSGLLQYRWAFVNYHLIMEHLAGTATYDESHHLEDNGGMVVLPGINLSQYTFFDSLSVSSGYAVSYDRKRGLYDLKYFRGWITNINIAYKGYGVSSWLYKGDGQYQVIGDHFYTAPSYMRFDIYFTPVNNKFVKARFIWAVHHSPGEWDNSQLFQLTFNFDGLVPFKDHL